MVTGIAATNANSSAQNSLSGLSEDFDQFLTLLLTQLQSQDPTSPMDTDEFTQQLVSFTEVEQSIETNSNLEKVISLLEQQTSGIDQGSVVEYIGKEVIAAGDTAQLAGGAATWKITADVGATNAVVGIYNAAGDLVAVTEQPLSEGGNLMSWDGRDPFGTLLPDGEYSIIVEAMDEFGNPVAATTDILGTVTAVDFADGEFLLHVRQQEPGTDIITTTLISPERVKQVNDSLFTNLEASNAQTFAEINNTQNRIFDFLQQTLLPDEEGEAGSEGDGSEDTGSEDADPEDTDPEDNGS